MKQREDGFTGRKRAFNSVAGMHVLSEEEKTRLKETMLDMFRDFRRVAAKERLLYTMSGGSVLGTVRHEGFIPWDDDIDINMPRRDFERFRRIFDRALGDRYVLCTPVSTPGHGMALVQMKKKGTICRSYNELSKPDALSGIALDFFIIENVSDSAPLRFLQGVCSLAAGYLISCRKTYADLPQLEPYMEASPELRGMFGRKARIGSILRFIPLDTAARLAGRIYAICRNDHSRYVSIPTGRKHFFRETYLRADVCRRRPGIFEGMTVPVPAGCESYLTALYGPDYMTPPPPELKEHHPIMELDFCDGDRRQNISLDQ